MALSLTFLVLDDSIILALNMLAMLCHLSLLYDLLMYISSCTCFVNPTKFLQIIH